MRLPPAIRTLLILLVLAPSALFAQSSPGASSATVPRLINISGVFQPADGQPPGSVEGVTLSIYAAPEGGLPLWQERQTVTLDHGGRFTLLLGATHQDGVPSDVFASGEAQWLAMRFERVGEVERARVRITSVPYALQASDAATLGGRPASAYVLAPPAGDGDRATSAGSETDTAAATALPSPGKDLVLAGTTNVLAKYVNGSDVGNSAVYEAGGMVGVGTTTPLDYVHVRFTDPNGATTGMAVQNLGNTATSYSGTLFYDQFGALGQFQGFNNVTHEYRINNIARVSPGGAFNGSINFMLGSVSRFKVRADGDIDLPGSIWKGGERFLHNFGTGNTFLGANAGNVTMTGGSNTASGYNALAGNTTGVNNVASGYLALNNNTTGSANVASGRSALALNTTGSNNMASGSAALSGNTTGVNNVASGASALALNTIGSNNVASGASALVLNTTGSGNVASGISALGSNTTGAANVAVGANAGLNATTGSNNIYLGTNAGFGGVAGEANTIYLGLQGTHTKTVIGGIRGITTGLADAVPVVIDSTGQLGTVSSSRRFKEQITDMGDASRALFALRPVTFRYTQPSADGTKPLQYGLVAEEVAEVFPALAVRGADGGVETVHYETLNVLLVNELQKLHRRMVALEEEVRVLRQR